MRFVPNSTIYRNKTNFNMLFVAHKPPNISSNAFLTTLKKRFSNRTLGFSGTLDPFASGTLVVASDKHTRLFSHFNLSPKVYIATLWLGAESPTLDIEGISCVSEVGEISIERVESTIQSLKGKLTYTPPKFSAKKVGGIRAYHLARENADFTLGVCEMEIFDIALLRYNHPFLTFQVSVSKGAYIRSLGEIIAERLGVKGALSALKRVAEGDFAFESYKMLNPLDFIAYPKLSLPTLKNDFLHGKKLHLGADSTIFSEARIQKNQKYIVIFDDFFSIIRLDFYGRVEYILNRIDLC